MRCGRNGVCLPPSLRESPRTPLWIHAQSIPGLKPRQEDALGPKKNENEKQSKTLQMSVAGALGGCWDTVCRLSGFSLPRAGLRVEAVLALVESLLRIRYVLKDNEDFE